MNALFRNTSSSNLTAVGDSALFNNNTGYGNTAIGSKSLYSNTSGFSNTANGYQTLYSNTTASANTAFGLQALFSNTTGSNNTGLGYNTNVATGNLSNATAIGANSRVDCSNCMVLGSVLGISFATSNVNVGIGTTNPTAPLSFANTLGKKISLYESAVNSQYGFAVGGGQLQIYSDAVATRISFGYYNSGTFTERMFLDNSSGTLIVNGTGYPSDIRYKKQITPLQHPLEKIMAINGVEYFMRTDEFPSKHFDTKLQVGLIAQEVEKVLPQVVQTGKDGYRSVDYAKVVPLLVEGIKEQQHLIENQRKQIDTLSTHDREQQKQIDELKKLVEKLAGK